MPISLWPPKADLSIVSDSEKSASHLISRVAWRHRDQTARKIRRGHRCGLVDLPLPPDSESETRGGGERAAGMHPAIDAGLTLLISHTLQAALYPLCLLHEFVGSFNTFDYFDYCSATLRRCQQPYYATMMVV